MVIHYLIKHGAQCKINFVCREYSRYYAEVSYEWSGPSPRLIPGQHSSEETLQTWRAVGDIVLDLISRE